MDDMDLFTYDRKQLAALTEKIIEQYFKWILTEERSIPGVPEEYQEKLIEYIRKYIRICGLLKLPDGSWTPFLRSVCTKKETSKQELIEFIPQQAEDLIEDSVCSVSSEWDCKTPRPDSKTPRPDNKKSV